jgi:hypothetical protein
MQQLFQQYQAPRQADNIIPFTQYMLPDGRTAIVSLKVEPPEHALALEVLDLGTHRFECEILTTGNVSLTCFNIGTSQDDAIAVTEPNPEGIRAATARMIRIAHASAKENAIRRTRSRPA